MDWKLLLIFVVSNVLSFVIGGRVAIMLLKRYFVKKLGALMGDKNEWSKIKREDDEEG
jgi:hypothetical protein